ncbi:transposase [Escherichia coli O157:H7 str. K1795]|uniref:IS3 family transposase n=1 Tax=Escherichia coli TaxID=562 RepID=UPI00044EFD90|nr:IS3 family transposase [Escherichia coli]EZB67767.1 transposase [Escherichia coli O157:H7 str. K1795]
MLPRFADIFQQGNRWLNWLEKQPEGSVRPVVIESVTKIMACGTTLMGYTQWCCSSPDCSHIKKVCFRCKSRSCPHCGVKAGAQWIQYLLSLVPDCPWQHIVFTLPCQYWSLVFHNRWLLAEMSRIAADVIQEICRQKRRWATTNSNHNLPVAPNLLNQTFAPTAPNQVWVADLTYVATQEGWLYLAGIKDVYTCEIVGYAMGERMTKELTGKALFMALRSQRPPAGLIHHSDRGSQYCAYDYRVIQEQFGLKTSMSRKGNCYDNAPMESFWGTLKNESLSHYRFKSRDEAISVIREYIEIFYNRQRRHSRLGNISPAAFREKYHQMAA